MVDEFVDEFVLSQLSPDEKIEIKIGETGNTTNFEVSEITWFATNKRIIKFEKTWFFLESLNTGKSLRDLDYKHLVSIELMEKRYYSLLILSALILFSALIIRGISAEVFTKASISNAEEFLTIIYAILILIAIIIAFYALTNKQNYYQFYAPSIKLHDWRIVGTGTSKSKKFIQTIRGHCFFK